MTVKMLHLCYRCLLLTGQMRSLRIFYSDDKCSSGQLVIASRESQYKILHFHHGGLGHLADTFADWKFLAQPEKVSDVWLFGQTNFDESHVLNMQ